MLNARMKPLQTDFNQKQNVQDVALRVGEEWMSSFSACGWLEM